MKTSYATIDIHPTYIIIRVVNEVKRCPEPRSPAEPLDSMMDKEFLNKSSTLANFIYMNSQAVTAKSGTNNSLHDHFYSWHCILYANLSLTLIEVINMIFIKT